MNKTQVKELCTPQSKYDIICNVIFKYPSGNRSGNNIKSTF